jgi:hypothetical protein
VASVVLDSQYSRRAWELAVFQRDRDGGAATVGRVKLRVPVDLTPLRGKDRISSQHAIAHALPPQSAGKESIAPQHITVDDFGNGVETHAS